jgi:hypothetical protein
VQVVAAALDPVDLIQADSSESGDLPRVLGNEAIVRLDATTDAR